VTSTYLANKSIVIMHASLVKSVFMRPLREEVVRQYSKHYREYSVWIDHSRKDYPKSWLNDQRGIESENNV
jgi:hypothetical protein